MKIEEAIKQTKFESNFQKAILNLVYTANWLDYDLKQFLKPYEITPQQYNVLRILKGRYPESHTATSIKEVMLDKTPDLTRLIDRLLKKDYVNRQVCPTNRRQVEITINKKGLQLLEKIRPALEDQTRKIQNINEQEASTLNGILDKLRG